MDQATRDLLPRELQGKAPITGWQIVEPGDLTEAKVWRSALQAEIIDIKLQLSSESKRDALPPADYRRWATGADRARRIKIKQLTQLDAWIAAEKRAIRQRQVAAERRNAGQQPPKPSSEKHRARLAAALAPHRLGYPVTPDAVLRECRAALLRWQGGAAFSEIDDALLIVVGAVMYDDPALAHAATLAATDYAAAIGETCER